MMVRINEKDVKASSACSSSGASKFSISAGIDELVELVTLFSAVDTFSIVVVDDMVKMNCSFTSNKDSALNNSDNDDELLSLPTVT